MKRLPKLVLLCGLLPGLSPAACLWSSGPDWLGRLDPATSRMQAWQLSGVATVATADDACRVWAATSSSLLRIDANGLSLQQTALAEAPAMLAANPHSGEVYAIGKTTLYRYSASGTLLASLAVDGKPVALVVDQDESLWLSTDKALLHYAKPVTGGTAFVLLASLTVKADAFAVDNLGNQVWLAQNKTLTRYRLPDLALLGSGALPEQAVSLSLDPVSGDLFMAGKKTWQHLNRSGQMLASADLKALNLDGSAMSWDGSQVWLAHKSGFARLSPSGQVLGQVSATSPASLSSPPFRILPVLELIAPGTDIVTNQTRPTFIVRKAAQCNGQPCNPAGYTLNPAARLDNVPVSLSPDTDPERLRYTPSSLSEGVHVFTATLTDRFGHSAAAVTSRVTVDITPPVFTSLSPADNTLFWFADTHIEGSVNEAGSLITLTPGYQSGMSPFRFAVSLNPGSNPYTLTALDRASNQTSQSLTLRYQPVEVLIDSPLANASINDDLVNISGRLTAPAGTTVSVNGKVVAMAAAGVSETAPVGFSLANLPLNPGLNTITATATLPTGQSVLKPVNVTSTLTGPASVTWPLEPVTPGRYKVLVRWPQGTSGRASNASYTASHAQGQTAVAMDQRVNGGTWQPLGTFELAPGLSHRVSLTDRADGTVVADAVRLEWVGATTTTGTGGTGQTATTSGEEEIFYVHPDHLGSPRVITNEAKQIVWRWDNSDPFGANKPNEDADGDGKTLTYNHRHQGQYWDEETGTHYNYFRDCYDPSTGRYCQFDPIGLAGGLNGYLYANANPLTYTDPLGLTSATMSWGARFGAAGAAAAADGPLPIGEIIGAGIIAKGIYDACKDDSCPPCKTVSGKVVPVGTVAYRPLDVIPDDVMQHGVYGSHHNIFVAKQAPRNSPQPCRCQWVKQKYVLKPYQLTPDMIPIEPFVY